MVIAVVAGVWLISSRAAGLRLIDHGGGFPHDADGVPFGSRAGLLPSAGAGYHREYTVRTPGSPDGGRPPDRRGRRGRAVLDR